MLVQNIMTSDDGILIKKIIIEEKKRGKRTGIYPETIQITNMEKAEWKKHIIYLFMNIFTG